MFESYTEGNKSFWVLNTGITVLQLHVYWINDIKFKNKNNEAY